MDRYSATWLQQLDGLGGPSRVKMAGTEVWPPAPDGQQSEVELRRQITHGWEQVGVTGEVDGRVEARDQVTDRGGPGTEGLSHAVMYGGCRGQGHGADAV